MVEKEYSNKATKTVYAFTRDSVYSYRHVPIDFASMGSAVALQDSEPKSAQNLLAGG